MDNYFEDKTLGRVWDINDFQGRDEPVWWKGMIPLWASAEAQGVRSASMFWPCTGVDAQGRQPGLVMGFTPDLPMEQESLQVLAWLDLPVAEHPRFILLYFYYVDHAGHEVGPDGRATETMIREVDAAVGKLVAGLKQRKLFERADLIIVADHGMAKISNSRMIELDGLVNLDHVRVVTEGSLSGLEPSASRVERERSAKFPVIWTKPVVNSNLKIQGS